MKFSKVIIPLIVLFFYGIIILLFIETAYASVKITGKRADVDLADIFYPGRKISDEIEIRKICAEVIEKYNNKGFTAFKIKNAVLKNDGTLELVVSDPVVENVFITGADPYNESIADEIYVKSEAFNEFILNDNIVRIKKVYPVRKMKVDLIRNDNDNIDIYITADKRILHGAIIAASDPVYGAITSVSATSGFSSSMITAKLDTTAGIREVCYTKTGIDYSYNFRDENLLSLVIGFRYNNEENYIDEYESSLFEERTIEGETGVVFNKDASSVSLTAFSFYTDYKNYPGIENGYYFSGFSADYKYNDKAYRIDPLDTVTAEIDYTAVWNPLEKKIESRFFIKGDLSIPLAYFCSLTAFIESDYTSEDKKVFHSYVFDRTFPLRNQEYALTKWRHVARPGLLFDVYNRFMFISPEYIAGIYETHEKKKSVHGISIRGVLRSSSFSSQVAYILECGEPLKEGVLTFEASAVF